jgi:hypothetical protein
MTIVMANQRKGAELNAAPGSPALSWGASALSKVVEKRISDLQKLTAAGVSMIGKTTDTQPSGTVESQLRLKLATMK